MAGNNSRAGSGRGPSKGGAGVSDAPKSIRQLASVSQAAFERRYQRASRNATYLRRYDANASRPNYSREANQRRELQATATSNRARAFYEGLRTNRTTGMPQSLQAGFADRQRLSTGTKKKAGAKRSRMVKA